jgi:hypothetical protein
MKRWEILVGLTIVLVAMLFVPKELWMHQRRARFRELEKQIETCRSIPCMTRLEADLHALNAEVDNRPWYVWGDLSLK